MLGRGRSGTVYLARHKDLEEYRAIKQVPKTCADYRQFRQEALILKEIRHPGIPIVYDLEEDEDGNSYLIEEFLEGDSLYALVSDMGHFSKAMTIHYGIQICHLVTILHSAKPTPVLYLDLQPKNLLVCHDTVKLVDFDHAVHLTEAEHLKKRYGTVGFAAPEQYTGDPLDERTDIYAIGAVLYYMLTGRFPGDSPVYPKDRIDGSMAAVLRICLRREPQRRYASVNQLCDALLQLQRQNNKQSWNIFGKIERTSLVIAAAGAAHGVGTTHVAMGLAAWLQANGCAVLYEEKNPSGAVRQYADCLGAAADSWGILRIRGLPMKPCYGAAVRLKPHPYRVIVCDCGVADDHLRCEEADGYLLVCGSKPWEQQAAREAFAVFGTGSGKLAVYNHFSGRIPGQRFFAPGEEISCFLMPCGDDPWRPDKQTQRVYEAILKELTGERKKGVSAVWRLQQWVIKGKQYLSDGFSILRRRLRGGHWG